jgi:hypothetical protein
MANVYRRSWQSLRVELDRHGVRPFEYNNRNYGRVFLRREVETLIIGAAASVE